MRRPERAPMANVFSRGCAYNTRRTPLCYIHVFRESVATLFAGSGAHLSLPVSIREMSETERTKQKSCWCQNPSRPRFEKPTNRGPDKGRTHQGESRQVRATGLRVTILAYSLAKSTFNPCTANSRAVGVQKVSRRLVIAPIRTNG